MNPSDRLEWYKQASANLRKYLSELEAALVSGQFADTKPTDYVITDVKRRIEDFDRLIKEAK